MNYDVISSEVFRPGNAWQLTEYRRYENGTKRRAIAHRGFHGYQCIAQVDQWTDTGWTMVLSLPLDATPMVGTSASDSLHEIETYLRGTVNRLFIMAEALLD